MAQWKEKLEPYVKVTERVKTAALNPTAGEDLIIGVVLISDAGPCKPTLIRSQSDFMKTFASQDITQDYIKSLNQLYQGADKTIPATMWANAYKLAGSNTLLVCRAAKANDIYFAKPMKKGDISTYILRDGELMKKVESFKIVVDIDGDNANHSQDGWSIAINGVGILGNLTTDEGAQYDNYVQYLPDLIDVLNDTTKFFSPKYTFYSDIKGTVVTEDPAEARSVILEEVYLGTELLDLYEDRCQGGLQYVVICTPEWDVTNTEEIGKHQIALNSSINSTAWSGFDPAPYYATNVYNTSTPLKIRVRRFNHDAVVSKELGGDVALNANSASPYTVIESVLDTFTSKGSKEPSAAILARDFYEVAVFDPSLSEETLFFNIGNIIGRGDIEVSELNDMLGMIQVELPDNMRNLGLNYYGYATDDKTWKQISVEEALVYNPDPEEWISVDSKEEMYAIENPKVGEVVGVSAEGGKDEMFVYTDNGDDQFYLDLSIDPTKYHLLDISDTDLKKAVDELARDEVYVTEGLCDLGNTEPSFQNYLAALAVSQDGNYFYPISSACSTNYLTIANSYSKIGYDSYKLYASAPWDIDTGTLGWKVYISPAVLYWQSVARARSNNQEFRPQLGQGVPYQYQRPMTEFNKKTRQLLLSRRINTMKWDNQISAYIMNDNYTYQTEDTIMSDDGNSRLAIRISKTMPELLRQFIGYRISDVLYDQARSVIDYWFRTTILPMGFTIDGYRIIIDETNNTDEDRRANRMHVTIQVRFYRSLKYIEVYNELFDAGMSFDE